jgi:hypothetical protein
MKEHELAVGGDVMAVVSRSKPPYEKVTTLKAMGLSLKNSMTTA